MGSAWDKLLINIFPESKWSHDVFIFYSCIEWIHVEVCSMLYCWCWATNGHRKKPPSRDVCKQLYSLYTVFTTQVWQSNSVENKGSPVSCRPCMFGFWNKLQKPVSGWQMRLSHGHCTRWVEKKVWFFDFDVEWSCKNDRESLFVLRETSKQVREKEFSRVT